MEKKWAELERKFNISSAQQHILFLLATNKNVLTPSKISELGCWHTSTVTRLLQPLQKRGFINVTTNKEQSRYKIVTITVEGKEILDKLMDAVRDMEQFPLDTRHLSKEEVTKFLDYGQSILDVHKGNDFMEFLINARVKDYDYDSSFNIGRAR
ncbi:MarR family winged helix-turn-helix transcriptional regulator [Bacillus solitudinis]|uniref:MarR family winged helix-turn-helix transcriptional regulator n=1 Tax=Bacillus solitudinis TaxID=2014074 RepID=UPI001D0D70B3|nr:MarR family transcriptional regulator [Bacillus solitudinis]